MSENRTLDYYNKNASSFAETTIDVDFQEDTEAFSRNCCLCRDISLILGVVLEEILSIF